MSWFPVGPNFVFGPRDMGFRRLSRRNEVGLQGLVSAIAVDPTDANQIYIAVRPSTGGAAAYHSADGGASWEAISDALQQADETVLPSAIAVNPKNPAIIYLATDDGRCFTSSNRGAAGTWSAAATLGGFVTTLLVDPNTAATPATTVLYAAATGDPGGGVWLSTDGAGSFKQVQAGHVRAMVGDFTTAGAPLLYAAVDNTGVLFSDAPDTPSSWVNLNSLGIGLPTDPALTSKFDGILIDRCPANGRLYAVFAAPSVTKLTAPIVATGTQTASVVSTAVLANGASLVVDTGANQETVVASAVNPTTFTADFQKTHLVGAQVVTGSVTTLTAPIVATGTQTASVGSTVGLANGASPVVDTGANQETVVISDVKPTTFTADFQKTHLVGAPVVNFSAPGNEQLAGLYTSTSPLTAWKQVSINPVVEGPPPIILAIPQQGLYNFGFAVAPNSPGTNEGVNDILFFAGWQPYRSVDGGRSWAHPSFNEAFHDDYHTVAFSSPGFNGGAVPTMFIGCDGGIARSDRFADPTQTFTDTGSQEDYWDSQAVYFDTGEFENLNHGLQSSACVAYTAVQQSIAGLDNLRSLPALSYIACQDTALAGGAASPGWRSLQNDDSYHVAASLGPNGTSIWEDLDGQVYHFTDQGGYFDTPNAPVTMAGAGGSSVNTSAGFPSPGLFTVGLDGLALAGLAATNQVFVGRMDHTGVATQISQDFGNSPPVFVAASPVDKDQLYCVTSDGQLWHTASGSTANASTVWAAMPAGISGLTAISAITVDQASTVFVLMKTPVTVGSTEFPTTTPLFRADTGGWTPITCTGLPTAPTAPGSGYGRIVADPRRAGTLYAAYGGSVFEIAVSGNSAAWTSVSTGLPGGTIYDLWATSVTDVRTETNPITLVRAAVPTRGVWELALPDPSPAAPLIYLRDNIADLGWIDTAQDGGPDPYSTGQIWHYQCADIKVDKQTPASGFLPAFFQTDPEYPIPISQVAFDMMQDNSQKLTSGDPVMVHVQVHNRSSVTANEVIVWAIACNASAGVPPLSAGPFDFWSQFHIHTDPITLKRTASVIPALPPFGPWVSIGTPVIIQTVDAAHPQVASWNWTAPTVDPGDSGHYCVMAFLHSADSPLHLGVSGGDEATVASVQVGQKNLHIAALSASPGSHRGTRGHMFLESVDFWNPTTTVREATLVFDLRRLHPNILPALYFSKLDTTLPMPQAVTGYTKIVSDPLQRLGLFGHLLDDVLHAADRVEDEVEDAVRGFFGLGHEHDPDDLPIDLPPGFEPVAWIGQRSSIIEVRGVRIPPGKRVRALLNLQTDGPLPPGATYRAEVQQAVSGQLAGGSTFVVRVA